MFLFVDLCCKYHYRCQLSSFILFDHEINCNIRHRNSEQGHQPGESCKLPKEATCCALKEQGDPIEIITESFQTFKASMEQSPGYSRKLLAQCKR